MWRDQHPLYSSEPCVFPNSARPFVHALVSGARLIHWVSYTFWFTLIGALSSYHHYITRQALAQAQAELGERRAATMKYAFDEQGGVVRVCAAAAGPGRQTLTFEDNGQGLPPGFDPEQSGGFGMQLVQMLVRQVGGTLEVEHTPGVRFVFTLPLD